MTSERELEALADKLDETLGGSGADNAVLASVARSLREIARRLASAQQAGTKCWCETCRPQSLADMRFIVCPDCGNKRCPKATDHRNACTNSNEPDQPGSSFNLALKKGSEPISGKDRE